MKNLVLGICLMILGATSAHAGTTSSAGDSGSCPQAAAVSPYLDSVEKIKTILESQAVENSAHGKINSISATGDLTYEVDSDMCTVKVLLERESTCSPGKTLYQVKQVNSICE